MTAAHPRIARFVGDRETGWRAQVTRIILPIAVAWRGPDPAFRCEMHRTDLPYVCSRCGHRFVELDDAGAHVRQCPRPRWWLR